MRILVCTWRDLKHPLAGGAEVYTDAIASEWVRMGHSVTLFCANVDGEVPTEISQNGYHIVRKGSRFGVYRQAKKFWEREGSGNYDLVVDEVNTRPFLCSRFITDANVVGLIFQVAREVWFYEANIVTALAGRYLLEPLWLRRLRDINVVTISQSSKTSLEAYGLQNVSVVPIGSSMTVTSGIPKERDPTFVFLGRLSKNKRPDHAIKAFEIVRRTVPNAKMWIIGDGPMRSSLQKYHVDGVEFLGRLAEPQKAMRLARAHLLLVTSTREGWGMVVTEAAFAGTPALGYSVDGLRDSLFVHGGGTVDPCPDLLAQAIIKFLSGDLKLSASTGLEVGGVLPWTDVATALLESWEPVAPVN